MTPGNFENFELDDFLQDDYFINSVQSPTKDTEVFWENWLRENPERQIMYIDAVQIVKGFHFEKTMVDEAFYLQLKKRIDTTISKQETHKPKVVRMIPRWTRVAAAIMAVVLSGWLVYYLASSSKTTVTTQYAQTKTIVLPDSSEIILNANSSISFASNWDDDKREVWLDGEGFFKIRHIDKDENRAVKFIVHANDADVEVLGTEFNVKTRDKENQVLLQTGSIRLNIPAEDRSLLLHPNDFVRYNAATHQFITSQVNPAVYTAWIDHKYIFENTSLSDVCQHLQEYFGTPFEIKNKDLATQKISGTLELKNEELLINTLSNLLKTGVKRSAGRIIIDTN